LITEHAVGDRHAYPVPEFPMARHNALIRETLTEFSEAQEILTAGDSFFIVISKPSDAVRFVCGLTCRAARRVGHLLSTKSWAGWPPRPSEARSH